MDLVEPNDDERRNGWTAESLTAYLRERAMEEGREYEAYLNRPRRQRTAVKDWNPLTRLQK